MYIDNSRIEHESYSAACEYYGADAPEQVAAEVEYYAAIERDRAMDRMETTGSVEFYFDPWKDDMPW